ncbi:hypothetical protein WA026_017839 [Henosepilachna vigintioctopunctata]|uniref:Uncharacterized protein n=1 Tax=Henosepilachna vigintioctopunctata TaxID=420089 RepID=A0AAW1TVJ2_9CUCU
MENLSRLELFPQVKFYLAKGLLAVCPIRPLKKGNDLIFGISNEREIRSKLNFENISLAMNAMKNFDSELTEFTVRCLWFLLRLLNFKGLRLNGLYLNENNIVILSKELRIESLSLCECGPYVNTFIQRHNTGEMLSHLTELDISYIDIETTTLEKIGMLPLKILNLHRSIKNSKRNHNVRQTNIDVLWEAGILKNTIQVLDVSMNDLTRTNLEKILTSQVRDLDISQCLTFYKVNFSSLVLPNTLKDLKAVHNETTLEDFHKICESSIESIEIDLRGVDNIEHELELFTCKETFKSFSVFDGRIYHHS